MINYDEKIRELEGRIEVLEKAEQKRKREKIIKLVFRIILVIIVIAFMIYLYHYIQPYLKQIKDLSGITDRAKEGGNFLKDQYNSLIGG